MPNPVFLTEPRPLLDKVAAWLIASSSDLSRSAVVLPTSAAGRRLRAHLGGKGSKLPLTTTPMGLLALAAQGNVASESDSLLAWTVVLSRVSLERYPALLANFADLKKSALRIAQSLRSVCSLLAEAGLTPASPEILQVCSQEEERWREIESLYRRYLKILSEAELQDANEAHLAVARSGRLAPGIEHVVVAGVPDLNLLVQRYLEGLAAVDVLVDAPDCGEDRFDTWGRPDAETWLQRVLSLRPEDVHVAADPFSEAEILARFLTSDADTGVCTAETEAISFQKRALRKHGLAPYDPAGKPLLQFECAAMAILWLSFSSSGQLDELRALAEHPVFLRALCAQAETTPSQALRLLDAVRTNQLIDSLVDARIYFHSGETSVLLGVVEAWTRKFVTAKSLENLPPFLTMLYTGRELAVDSSEAAALEALTDLLRSIVASPLASRGRPEEVFRAGLDKISIPEKHSECDVELNGWLEAPWLSQKSLVITGCVEGSLPAHLSSHPFLPDSARTALGLQNNTQRYARDLFLLHGLLSVRAAGSVKLLLSRTGADGEPAKPSRALFRCGDEELPERVDKFFGPPISLRASPAREQAWKVKVQKIGPPASLRVTGFGEYLRCPMRFYLKQLLRMQPYDAQKVEMDAVDFGILLHKVVENFANDEAIRDSNEGSVIEKFVLAELDSVITERFGRRLSLPVRVQRESLRARLRQFARIQAAERRAGWRIQQGEFRFEKDRTLSLGGLLVTASLDRVEVHERTGQRRILDYKTFAQAKSPADTHWGMSDGEFPEAEFLADKKPVRWQELQLPLYRALASFLWPDDPVAPMVGYFLLPERVEESAIVEFDLGEDAYDSAVRCAEAVASRISRGVFWPPREVAYDDFEGIFLGGDPGAFLDEDSISFLRGK